MAGATGGSLGNITVINRSGQLPVYYTYDAQNQLIRVSEGDFRYEYTYDTYGNIRSVKRYENETDDLLSSNSYAYEDPQWIDRLTAFNNVQFTYDNIGNPLSYYNGSSYTFTWNGRELMTAVKGGVTTTYKYGADGLRTQKKVGSTTYNYYYNSKGQLIRQTWGTNYMDFLYDETGSAYSFIYNGTQYYYVKNLQGDVVKILNTSGSVVASYSYDAWGKVTNSGNVVGQYNPIRYRGYYYDTETRLYYISSRYYDPEIGRWISPEPNVYNGDFDKGVSLIGYNVYTYCANNPTNFSDPTGEFAIGVMLGKAFIGATVNVLTTYIGAKVTGQSYSLKDAGFAALTGAFGTGNLGFKIAAAAVSGIYTGVTASQNGASTGGSVIAGLVSAGATILSVSNIAEWMGGALQFGLSTFTDIVFGTSSNSISAAVYRASIES